MTDTSQDRKRTNNRITHSATAEGRKRAEHSLKRLGFSSKTKFAEVIEVSRSTVTKFFAGKSIELDYFEKICNELKLSDWKEIADLPAEEILTSATKNQEISVIVADEDMKSSSTSTRQVVVKDKQNNTTKAIISKSQPSGTDQSIPYVISPRHTRLDTRRPKLCWNKVKGATAYTVKLVTDSGTVWSKTVKEAEYNSPEDLPLKVGVDYWLIVEADNGSSSEMDSDRSKLKFRLLDEDKLKSLPDDVTKITDLKLAEDEEALELANLYFGQKYGLLAKATQILEQRIAAGSQTSEVYVTVGNLYLVVGLYSLAEERYRKALALIKPGMELEQQIIAKAGLAEICTLLGNKKEAEVLMQERKANLEALSLERQSRAITESSRARAVTRMSCNCVDKNGIPGKYYGSRCQPNSCSGG